MVLDKLKKGFKALAHGTRVIGTSLAASIAFNRKKNELKRVLLNRLTVSQLDEIGVRIGVSLKGLKSKREKISELARHLSFKEVVEFARRYKIKYKDIVEELDRFKAQLEAKKTIMKAKNKIEELLDALKEFAPEPVKDEEDLEKQLYQYLKARLPKIPIKRQVQLGQYRVDLQAGPCGIELKIPTSATHLQRLIGQVRDYSEYLECMITVILDTGKVKDLSSYVKQLEETGIIPIIVKGQLKQTKQQTRTKTKNVKTKRKRR